MITAITSDQTARSILFGSAFFFCFGIEPSILTRTVNIGSGPFQLTFPGSAAKWIWYIQCSGNLSPDIIFNVMVESVQPINLSPRGTCFINSVAISLAFFGDKGGCSDFNESH
jgi:hypothetical protein